MAGRVAYYGGIVKDGLVLNLDAAKRDSYPGSGTTWRDISGNQNNGTLINGPTFNSDNGGSFVFDGSNDYVNTNYTPPTSNFTVNIVYKCNNPVFWAPIWGCEVWNSLTGYIAYFERSGILEFSRGGGGSIRTSTPTTATANYTFTLSSNGAACIYINGILRTSGTITLASSITRPIILSARYDNGGGGPFDIRASTIPYLSIYNRALTAQEVLQNYNATKGRYGL